MMKTIPPIAIQLWSVRPNVNTDFPGTLKTLAKMGYQGVELAGFGNLKTPEEVARACADAGLEIVTTHIPVEMLRNRLDGIVKDTKVLGTRRVVCPILPAADLADAESARKTGRELNAMGARFREAGIQFFYHIHGGGEFKMHDGKCALDWMLENCDPENVRIEIDLLWVANGGLSPDEFIRKMGGRGTMLHVKDGGADKKSTLLGAGKLEFDSILSAARDVGAVEWLIVEQEHFQNETPMEAAETNAKKIRPVRLKSSGNL